MAEDLTQYIRAFKGILTTAKQYQHVLDKDGLEFYSFFVAQDLVYAFSLRQGIDGNLKLDARGAADEPTLEQLAQFAINYKIQPKDLINSFCSALGKPLAKHLADSESKRLENQILYLLEMPNT